MSQHVRGSPLRKRRWLPGYRPIDLVGSGELTRGYEAGNIVATRYDAGRLPDESALQQDPERLMDLYGVLVQSQDALAEDEIQLRWKQRSPPDWKL